ncbi:hypothetical protein AMTRI_Chr11g101900 [Amborella trichopoda]
MSSVVAIEIGFFFPHDLYKFLMHLFSIIKVGFFSFFSRFTIFYERVVDANFHKKLPNFVEKKWKDFSCPVNWVIGKSCRSCRDQSQLMLIKHQELRFLMKG